MAILEIHEDGGRVRRVSIRRDHPSTFGGNASCDIVLQGVGVLPIHGRFRWKKTRYKVEATPQAGQVEVNGRREPSSSFRRGDELRVGTCRIFFLTDDEPLPRDAAAAAPAAAEAEIALPAMSTGERRDPPPARPLESFDWMGEMATTARSTEAAEPLNIDAPARRAAVGSPPPRTSWLRRAGRTLAAGDQVPGEERLGRSPLVLGLIGTLAVLVLLGFALQTIVERTLADRLFRGAEQNFDDGQYRNAIRELEVFLKNHPRDARVSKARVMGALADVRQYAVGSAPIWSNALQAASTMVEQTSDEPAFADRAMELAELTLTIAEGLADRARRTGDGNSLKEAEQALALHSRIAGEPAANLLQRSRVPGKLELARAVVRKTETRAQTLERMDLALRNQRPLMVYSERDELVALYSDLAEDRAVIERLLTANEQIRLAARFDASSRPAETTTASDPLGPPLTLILRDPEPRGSAPAGDNVEAVVYAQAEGLAVGLDGSTGTPLWQAAVGLSAPFPPLPIPGGDPAALLVDSRDREVDELLRVDGRTGRLVWRQSLDERVADPPLILGNQVIQPLPSGKLAWIDLASGARQGTLELGRPLSRTPRADESGRYLYQLADEANLFVIRRDPPGCQAVVYLGHDAGSVPCPPARVGRFLIIPRNNVGGDGLWNVFVLEEDGARPRPAQTIPIEGWTWGTPPSIGSVIWSLGDRGGITAFSLGAYDAKEPLKPIASLTPSAERVGPTYGLPRTERECWVASARSGRLDLDPDRREITVPWTRGEAGPAVGPIQTAGKLAVWVQQFTEPGAVALWAIDPTSGQVAWKTVLGARWVIPPIARTIGDTVETLRPDGRRLVIAADQLQAGGFVAAPFPPATGPQLPRSELQVAQRKDTLILSLGKNADRIYVIDGETAVQSSPREVMLAAPLAAAPIFWGAELFAPTKVGRVDRIDPFTGVARGLPFVPPSVAGQSIEWLAPVLVENDGVVVVEASGTVRRLVVKKESGLDNLVVAAQTTVDKPIVSELASTGESIFLVTSDQRIRALAARDLSPLGSWPMESPLALGPVEVGGHVFVADVSGVVVAFDRGGRRLWSVTLRGGRPAGPPLLHQDGQVWFLSRSGVWERRVLADGSPGESIELGGAPVGGPIALGGRMLLPTGRGTLRLAPASAPASTLTPKSSSDGPTTSDRRGD